MGLKPGYKQTEVGVIPEDWEVRRIAQVCELVVDCKNRTPPVLEGGDYAVVRTPNVRDGKFVREDLRFTDEQSFRTWTSRAIPRIGDVLITREAPLGEVCLVPPDLPVCLGQRMMLYRPDKEKMESGFLLYVLMSAGVQTNLLRKIGGSTVGHAKVDDIRDLQLPIPGTTSEQQAIAEALSDADALIESLEQLLAKKRHLKQGAMEELLTGKKRLPAFSADWVTCRVGEVIVRFFCGPSPTCEERNIASEEEWGVLKTTAITWENGWDWTRHKALPKAFWNRNDQEIRDGDVIVTKAGPRHRVGVTCWVDYSPERILVSGKMIGLRPDMEKAVPLMLAAAISSREPQEYLNQRTTGMAESQVNFENTALLQTPILLPEIEEQRAISRIINDIETEITALESKLTKARQLKTGMMHELLTGRIRLGRSTSSVVPFLVKQHADVNRAETHNPQINEAVVLAVLASKFGTEQYPLARVRRTKLMYLLHRHVEHEATGFLKKAAGPYDPKVRYGGPEKIALKNRYVRSHHNGTYEGLIPGANIAQAEGYFEKWYGSPALQWVEQFHHKRTEELELLATIDMACVDLRREGKAVSLSTVKRVLQDNAEWKAKLDRPVFSDDKINAAIVSCQQLFPPEGDTE
ncbi:MAG: restriction endonuclease subunit S [Terracidiphilus sp.]|nr:restriction endonuclease subunit S [Terracidiphilus sp.]